MDNPDSAHQLAAGLRTDLARGEYHPRERLIESELVARYGFPRATVRSALLLLSAEGLVERLPNRGASVRSVSIGEGIELAEVRRELEALCAHDAAEKATDTERALMASALGSLRFAVDANDVHSYRQSSIGFHEMVISMSRHEGAARQLASIRMHNLQRHFPAAFQMGPIADSEGDHTAIGDAILAADADVAETAMRAHLDRVVALLVAYRDSRA